MKILRKADMLEKEQVTQLKTLQTAWQLDQVDVFASIFMLPSLPRRSVISVLSGTSW